KFDEMFSEAWNRFKDLLRKCPDHCFPKLHQIDTFYNAFKQSDQDSLNATAGGNLLNRTPRDALTIIENKSKVRTSRNKPIVSKVNTTPYSPSHSQDVTALTEIVKELVLMNKAFQQATVETIEENYVTYGGPHPYYECLSIGGNTFDSCAAIGPYNQGGNGYRPQGDLNYRASNQMRPPSFPPLNVQHSQNYNQKPKVILKPNPKLSVPYPSRLNEQKLHEKTNNQMLKFLQIFQRLHFDLSFADALIHIPKFASTFKSLLSNKEKLFELVNTLLTENCSAVLLKRLPEKLRDTGRFLIPCDFYALESCMALADLGASINSMHLSVGKKLSLPDLTLTRMTLELATRSIAYPTGRPFLRTARALVDVHREELILRDSDEKLIFHNRFPEVLKFKKSNHLLSGSTTPLSDSYPSLTPFETNDFLLEEFSDELALFNPFPSGNKDDNFDLEADLRKIKHLLNQAPSTKSEIDIIDPVLERFTNEPALYYSPPPGDDDDNDDDILTFSLITMNVKSFCMLLNNDSTLPEESYESSEIATLSSSLFRNEGKVFNPGLTRIMKTLVLVVLSFIYSSFNPYHAYIWESNILDLID
nr:reverse transcriptase domain-containing protein [Tanacetum cinerariifolium]